MVDKGYLTNHEIRVTALNFAQSLRRNVTRNGIPVSIDPTAKELVEDAKLIEAYIEGESTMTTSED